MPPDPADSKVFEEDETYSRSSLGSYTTGTASDSDGEQKILGIRWDCGKDELIFDIQYIASEAKTLEPTTRNVISLASKFYDPLGIVSPVIIQFKLLFQELCKDQRDWDTPLDGIFKKKWDSLVDGLYSMQPVCLPRSYLFDVYDDPVSYQLIGFCDASQSAYGAVVYIRIVTVNETYIRFVASKTRVSPIVKQTIPRLELLSALVLARLIDNIKVALDSEIDLLNSICYSDSKVALFWITQPNKEWKQFVQNRVDEIRTLIPKSEVCWKHCPGQDNPADILSRGINPSELATNSLWWFGPDWLKTQQAVETSFDDMNLDIFEDDCLCEMKLGFRKQLNSVTLVVGNEFVGIQYIIDCKDFSDKNKLLRITAYVLKFVALLKSKRSETSRLDIELSSSDIEQSENLWIRDVQKLLNNRKNYNRLCHQLNTFVDDSGIVRCGGRLDHSGLSYSSKYPILLDTEHWFTTLIVRDCHQRVMHDGVKATLAELRSRFWITRGRQFVRRLVYSCIPCKRFRAKPYQTPPTPPLPEFRVFESSAFAYIGLDYLGPLYTKSTDDTNSKVWVCLYTCCVTRAVHLEIVPDLTPEAFLRSFRRFTARRSIPSVVVSDNASTFKPAEREITKILKEKMVQNYYTKHNVKWIYTLPKAPWWGGFYERLVRSVKGCLKKTCARARMTYDELFTAITEVEMILNSRPISFISTEDIEEPLTPSHLICGHRIASLPDRPLPNDDDDDFNIPKDDLSKRIKHVKMVLNHFWNRWRKEYLVELRNSHYHNHRLSHTGLSLPSEGDIVLVHDEDKGGKLRRQWIAELTS